MTGFEQASTATLTTIRGNLLSGLDAVAATLVDGSFTTVGVKGAAPPSQSGQLTLTLLAELDTELNRRRVAAGELDPTAEPF